MVLMSMVVELLQQLQPPFHVFFSCSVSASVQDQAVVEALQVAHNPVVAMAMALVVLVVHQASVVDAVHRDLCSRARLLDAAQVVPKTSQWWVLTRQVEALEAAENCYCFHPPLRACLHARVRESPVQLQIRLHEAPAAALPYRSPQNVPAFLALVEQLDPLVATIYSASKPLELHTSPASGQKLDHHCLLACCGDLGHRRLAEPVQIETTKR